MRIGIPCEIKNHEHRVAITPAGCAALISDGHDLCVQAGAGLGSGFADRDYLDVGARMVETADEIWACDMVVKVKEPQLCEYDFLRPGLILFTFLHLAAAPELARVLLKRKVCAIGYETVQLEDGQLPILAQMSRIAGRVAIQLAVHFLQMENGTPFQGKGRLAGGIEGVPAAKVVILGAGNVGLNAAAAAAGLGSDVILLEANQSRIEVLQGKLPDRVRMQYFSLPALHELLVDCDILIGAALIPGKHAPELLKRSDFRLMQPGSVFMDVSIDQGGISETSHPTSYEKPVYVEEGVLHCCLPNLPGSVPLTSTMALTMVTLPYIQMIANHGIDAAAQLNQAISRGVNTRNGAMLHPDVAASLGY